ncbi:hypothetical protein AQUCO_00100287v1 [Aquilegia coerulea]|uniref:Methyltransferase domain-containing protein n=1 Tax=Aquilegia coerulea TaxID=218851 RepID=A0A2G5F9T1_AQUCA|nr:hypothetical protein AQUCO_00100287v1 [Aquilegia coerulea]
MDSLELQSKKKESVVELLERLDGGLVPDDELKELVKIQLEKRLQWGYKPTYEEQVDFHLEFINSLKKLDISGDMEMINDESYDIPISFLNLMFGKTLKQSACYFDHEVMTLDEAEIAMHDLYCERAQIKDGQSILDVGCGHGSLMFHIAQKFKNCIVTGITNSITQKNFIEEQCRNLKLLNVKVILADVRKYEMEAKFDRVIIIGTIEHMKNIQLFLKKISMSMKEEGLLFVDHLCHKVFPYHIEALDCDDWHSEYHFPKGSVTLLAASSLLYIQDNVSVVSHWILNGKHMARSLDEWQKNLLSNHDAAKDLLIFALGNKTAAEKCMNHYQTFHVAMSEQFSYKNGEEWMSSHILFCKKNV